MKFLTILTSIAALTAVSVGYAKTQVKANPECAKEEHFPQINKADLTTLTSAAKPGAFIVDVNSDESFKTAHVPGAVHYDKTFTSQLPKDKNQMIVAYCGGPACTAWKKAATEACNLGYTNIRHFKDGISGWTKTN